jgi:type 1 fimbriae regulatory protein FimB/type 1 fimbriae regulatory protein FimE
MKKPHLALVSPTTENGTVGPEAEKLPARGKRLKNAEVRTREHLLRDEVEAMIKAAGHNRNAHRDATLILVASRHGLRVSELCDLRWDQIDFNSAEMHIRRVKRGSPATHPIPGRELRWLRRLERQQKPKSAFVFTSERGSPFSVRGVHKVVAQLGAKAGLPFPVHPHNLRHACGFKLANDGVDTRTIQSYLGHKNIQHTVRYTALSAKAFKNLWDD